MLSGRISTSISVRSNAGYPPIFSVPVVMVLCNVSRLPSIGFGFRINWSVILVRISSSGEAAVREDAGRGLCRGVFRA